MERYIVKPEELKGEISNFPIQIVQKMVDYQVEQGNKANVEIFQLHNQMTRKGGGFDWNETVEGKSFWVNVIVNEYFNLFFQLYPKNAEKKKVRQNVLYKHFVYLLTAVADTDMSIEIKEKKGSVFIRAVKNKKEDLPIDTPCMCSNSLEPDYAWFVRFYAGRNQTWWELGKSHNERRKVNWRCIIPFDKFDPNNIEESLKHNIVKL